MNAIFYKTYSSAHLQSAIEHEMNSLVFVSVEPSSFVSDCSVMQNTSHGTVCVAAFKPGQVCVSGDLRLLM